MEALGEATASRRSPSPPPHPPPVPDPYFTSDAEAKQLQRTSLHLVTEALSEVSLASPDGDGRQHFDRPIAALIAAYAAPLRLYHCQCSLFTRWEVTELPSPLQLPPASYAEFLHHRLGHPALSARHCPVVECRTRVAALPATTNYGGEMRPGGDSEWGPSDVWVEGGVVSGAAPLDLQPPFLLLHYRLKPDCSFWTLTPSRSYVHYHPTLASLRAELLALEVGAHRCDTLNSIEAAQSRHALSVEAEGTGTEGPVEAARVKELNTDTLRLLRDKLRTNRVSLAFHRVRHL